MTHALAIKHPLDFTPKNGGTTLAEVLAKFFNCFWWENIKKRYQMSPAFNNPPKEVAADQTKLIDYWQVHSMSKILEVKFDANGGMEPGKPKVFAETFINELNTHSMQPADFSVRGIRNMVTRLFSIAAANVSQGQQPWPDNDTFVKNVKDVFAEIQKVARLK